MIESNAESTAADPVHDFRAAAERTMREAAARWKELADNAAAYIKENPGKAVLAGLGVGLVLGSLFRR